MFDPQLKAHAQLLLNHYVQTRQLVGSVPQKLLGDAADSIDSYGQTLDLVRGLDNGPNDLDPRPGHVSWVETRGKMHLRREAEFSGDSREGNLRLVTTQAELGDSEPWKCHDEAIVFTPEAVYRGYASISERLIVRECSLYRQNPGLNTSSEVWLLSGH